MGIEVEGEKRGWKEKEKQEEGWRERKEKKGRKKVLGVDGAVRGSQRQSEAVRRFAKLVS